MVSLVLETPPVLPVKDAIEVNDPFAAANSETERFFAPQELILPQDVSIQPVVTPLLPLLRQLKLGPSIRPASETLTEVARLGPTGETLNAPQLCRV